MTVRSSRKREQAPRTLPPGGTGASGHRSGKLAKRLDCVRLAGAFQCLGLALCFFLPALSSHSAPDPAYTAAAAKIDITPNYPIRLSGYGARQTESEGVSRKIWAKALAISHGPDEPALLLMVDNCGVPATIRDEVIERIRQKVRISPERVAICSTHTHSAPCLAGVLPNLFSADIPAEQQATIDRYTRELVERLEEVSLKALTNRQPARLSRGEGRAGFAKNRRTAGGPVDHSVPLLRVSDADNQIIAVLVNYACHCTTLGGEFNQVHGDWAGVAQGLIEADFPNVIALTVIGCGADANPHPRSNLDLARQHGTELAAEVKRLLSRELDSLESRVQCQSRKIDLPFDPLPAREQWKERARQGGIVGYHARKNLARLDRGETLPAQLPYLVQTWTFGNELAMVFLPGEVVVDYALRLKDEFDARRLWVTAYANDVPCYIPSRRILQEGGYEAETSLWYYDRPARLAPETEDLIIQTVHDLLPESFKVNQAAFPPPQSPEESLAAIETRPGLRVELVAAEPVVMDPVAIDFGADGRLWVAEMHDYPSGRHGNHEPGGRIAVLTDSDGDGRYDRRTVFLDSISFPTGLMAWKKGVLVCAAPDILYAQDDDGDGRADKAEVLYTGFATHNYQARVNSLRWGLDNWIYGASGLFGGDILCARTGQKVELGKRDFRMRPDSGEFEPVHGISQQGRVRDDFGNWFGCDNSTLLWHFPLPDHYLRRNPHMTAPARVYPVKGPEPNRLFPISRTLERFNDPSHANRVTSACGLEVYRDALLGAELAGNAFVCEPVHNLVHRLLPQWDGVTLSACRAMDEKESEFLASRDNWFRPVEIRTGPDGALWVVDMYRFVIEHPRWISPERLKQLDVRAGSEKGRIYRILPADGRTRPIRDLTKLSTAGLVSELGNPNGVARDLVHREWLVRNDEKAAAFVLEFLRTNGPAAGTIQALSVLDGLNGLTPQWLASFLEHSNESIRRQAVRLSEPFLRHETTHPQTTGLESFGAALLKLTDDPALRVRYQLALSLGEWNQPQAAAALARLIQTDLDNSWMRAAVLSSASRRPDIILEAVLHAPLDSGGRDEMIGQLMATAAGAGDSQVSERSLDLLLDKGSGVEPWQMRALGAWLDARQRLKMAAPPDGKLTIGKAFSEARRIVVEPATPETNRVAAIALLGREPGQAEADTQLLAGLLATDPGAIRHAALDRIRKMGHAGAGRILLGGWNRLAPMLRSEIIDLLSSREVWARQLMSAIERNAVERRELSAAQRQRLIDHSEKAIRNRALEMFSASPSAGRRQALDHFAKAETLPGDPARGAAVFARTCANCHRAGDQGRAVGPDLAGFRGKRFDDFLIAIIDPNAAVEPRFATYHVRTRDGRELTGIVQSETANSLHLIQAGGVQEFVLRSEVTEIRASSLSLMPEGLEAALSHQDMADLVVFLR